MGRGEPAHYPPQRDLASSHRREARRPAEPRSGDRALDLFFDLAFAVAIALWADRLAEHPTTRAWAWGVAKLVPIWMLWLGQTVFAAPFPSDKPRDRLLALAVVVAVGIMSTELVADAPRSLRFPIGFVAARAALLALYASVRCFSSEARRIADAYLVGFGAGAAIWALSVLLPGSHRPAAWALAIGVDFAVPWLARRRLQRMPRRSITDTCRRASERSRACCCTSRSRASSVDSPRADGAPGRVSSRRCPSRSSSRSAGSTPRASTGRTCARRSGRACCRTYTRTSRSCSVSER